MKSKRSCSGGGSDTKREVSRKRLGAAEKYQGLLRKHSAEREAMDEWEAAPFGHEPAHAQQMKRARALLAYLTD